MGKVFFVGVDVGTGSARAALVDETGRVYKTHVKPIEMWNPRTDHYEQSSDDVWSSVCECVQVSKTSQQSSFRLFWFVFLIALCDDAINK